MEPPTKVRIGKKAKAEAKLAHAPDFAAMKYVKDRSVATEEARRQHRDEDLSKRFWEVALLLDKPALHAPQPLAYLALEHPQRGWAGHSDPSAQPTSCVSNR